MKLISAAIIVLAAAILLTGGALVQHSDSRLALQVIGAVLGIIGLSHWFVSVKEK